MRTNVYIDASNLFYGGKKFLGWSIDYKKLYNYLKEKYQASQIYFFGGVEIHKFYFDYLKNETVPIINLEKYFLDLIVEYKNKITSNELELLHNNLKRVQLYIKLEKFGYNLILKPVKKFHNKDGTRTRKANCDVDMAFYLMRDINCIERFLVLSGDGDFLPVLKFLKENGKEVLILAFANRTAKEIKKIAGGKFMDFEYLRERLKRNDTKC